VTADLLDRALPANGFNAGATCRADRAPARSAAEASPLRFLRANDAALLDLRRLQERQSFVKCRGSKFRRSGTAIDCKSWTPSAVSIGTPARTRPAPRLMRRRSAIAARIFQLIGVGRLADERKSQVAHLRRNHGCKLSVLDRFETARQQIQNFRIQFIRRIRTAIEAA